MRLCHLENMESAAESQYDRMLQPDGKLKCWCGKLFNEDDGEVLSRDPYAMPVCPSCAKDYFEKLEQESSSE